MTVPPNLPQTDLNLRHSSLRQRRIGLTGGIATGKSTVSHYLEQRYSVPVFDADRYAREAVVPGSVVFHHIVHRYGPGIVEPSGVLDRSQLGEIIFAQPEERRWLEAQIHPIVQAQFRQALGEHQRHPVVTLSIPLLFEAGYHLNQGETWVTEIWVVTCSVAQQCHRLKERNGFSEATALRRIQAQMPLAEKCRLADHILDNSGSQADLYTQIDRLWIGF